MSNPSVGSPTRIPYVPVISYNKELAGWLRYRDIQPTQFGDYSLVPLKDASYGSEVLRYKPRNGRVDWFIFELRTPPDDVPRAPEQNTGHINIPNNGQTGVVIYEKFEIHRFAGIPISHPACGGLHGLLQSKFDDALDHEFGSCLWKVNNVNLFPTNSRKTLRYSREHHIGMM